MEQLEFRFGYKFSVPLHMQMHMDYRHELRERVAQCVNTLHHAGLGHILFSEHDIHTREHIIYVKEIRRELLCVGRGDHDQDPAQAEGFPVL